jgi:hypothetical protein
MSDSGTASKASADLSCFTSESCDFAASAHARSTALRRSLIKDYFRQESAVPKVLNHWLFIGANAYVEYTFVPWLGRSVYRRTVDYSDICIQ